MLGAARAYIDSKICGRGLWSLYDSSNREWKPPADVLVSILNRRSIFKELYVANILNPNA
jgi:hypothetical protein